MGIMTAIVSFLSSVIGNICGIGGGIIIKPVLDAFNQYSASQINFLSGVCVLSMTAYSVVRTFIAKENVIHLRFSSFLGVGAAMGGGLGKYLFDLIIFHSGEGFIIKLTQSVLLCLVIIGTLVFCLYKKKIHTKHVDNPLLCILIGLFLGIISSFLGIGGGPINLVVLYYFFSMQTKEAAQNSLFIILLSQIVSTTYTILRNGFPELPAMVIIMMAICGILGGIIGRMINRKIDNKVVDVLFTALLILLILICCYNIAKTFC